MLRKEVGSNPTLLPFGRTEGQCAGIEKKEKQAGAQDTNVLSAVADASSTAFPRGTENKKQKKKPRPSRAAPAAAKITATIQGCTARLL